MFVKQAVAFCCNVLVADEEVRGSGLLLNHRELWQQQKIHKEAVLIF